MTVLIFAFSFGIAAGIIGVLGFIVHDLWKNPPTK